MRVFTGVDLTPVDVQPVRKVTVSMELVEYFEAARPRLMSLAHRMVGSRHDAEDVVQTAWLKVQASTTTVSNPDAWFTTVTVRLCVDLLRARARRAEAPLPADGLPGEQLGADEAFLRQEKVSRALLVLLGELSPRQRVAYVLHDLFAVPFDQIAAILDANVASAKKLASRARAKLHRAHPAEGDVNHEHLHIVEAFLAAARGGDIPRLISLMAPDAVRIADQRLLPVGGSVEVHGATAIAEETRTFLDRITAAAPVLVAGRPGAVIAPGGHPFALIRFRIEAGLITEIEISPHVPGMATLREAVDR